MEHKSFIFNQFHLLFRNFFSLVLFEFIYKALGTFIIFPFFLIIMRKAIHMEIGDLLTLDNLVLIFSSPVNLIVIGILIILLSAYFLIEVSTITVGLKYSQRNRSVGPIELIKRGLENSLRFFKPKNWFSFILIYFFTPVLHFGLTSGISSIVYLKSFLDLYIGSEIINTVIIALIFLFSLVVIFFSFSFVFFTEYRVNIITGCILSLRVFKTNFIRTLMKVVSVIFSILLLTVLGLLFLGVISFICYEFLIAFQSQSGAVATSTALYRDFINIISPVFVLFSSIFATLITPFFFSGIYNIVAKDHVYEAKQKKSKTLLRTVAMSLILIFYSVFQGGVLANNVTDDSLIKAQTGGVLTGHRGNIKEEVQNTAASFESAIQNGAEYIELDVRRTKDNVLIVIHDSNLNELTGRNVDISEINYEDLKDLIVREEGRDTTPDQRFLTLDEAIDYIDGRAKLNIELKQIVNGDHYVEDVIEVLKNHGIEYDGFVASSDYTYLDLVESIDPKIQTLFLTDSGNGDIENLNVDSLSLSLNAISEELIERIHLRGKLVHAWILESKEDVENMLNYNADYLIVNDVRVAQTVLAENRPTQLEQFIEVMKLIIIHS